MRWSSEAAAEFLQTICQTLRLRWSKGSAWCHDLIFFTLCPLHLYDISIDLSSSMIVKIWQTLRQRWSTDSAWCHYVIPCTHCTMRFRRKMAKNVQLWTLVSPQIFIEKSWNFAQSCLNSSRIWGLFFLKKKPRKKCGKNQKTCWGCFRKSRVVSKKSSRKKNFFLENALFAETPPSSKKMGF